MSSKGSGDSLSLCICASLLEPSLLDNAIYSIVLESHVLTHINCDYLYISLDKQENYFLLHTLN